MTIRELFSTASAEILSYKARSTLTCISLSVGVAAMLYTLIQVDGMRKQFNDSVQLVGPGRLQISEVQGYVSKGLSKGLTGEDAEAIRRKWPELYMVYGLAQQWQVRMRYLDFKNNDIELNATSPEWRKRDWVYKTRGRFFDQHDLDMDARVCVLIEPGGWVHKPYWAIYRPKKALSNLLQHHDLLGKEIFLNDHLFTVIGILQEPPQDQDPRWMHGRSSIGGTVMIPITTFRHLFLYPPESEKGITPISEISVDTGESATVTLFHHRIEALLAERHRGESDFEVNEWRQIVAGVLEKVHGYMIGILIIGIVAIVAGCIGIMNVTLATTFSRIREIGIRRALGATRRDIVAQFVAEAMVLGLGSGILGIALGIIAAHYLVTDETRSPMIHPHQLAASLVLAVGASFVSSVFPARAASKFDPIEALRYE